MYTTNVEYSRVRISSFMVRSLIHSGRSRSCLPLAHSFVTIATTDPDCALLRPRHSSACARSSSRGPNTILAENMGRLATHIAAAAVDASNLPVPEKLPNISLIDALLPGRWSSFGSKKGKVSPKIHMSARIAQRAFIMVPRTSRISACKHDGHL